MEKTIATRWYELSKDNEDLLQAFRAQSTDKKYVIPDFFFHFFRPNGIGLSPYFENYPGGEEVYQRIIDIYNLTSDSEDSYFLLDNPKLLTREKLLELGQRHINGIRHILNVMGSHILISEDEIDINIIKGECPSDAFDNEVACEVYDLTGDYWTDLHFKVNNELLEIYDPVFYMACNYTLVYYALWPLVREQAGIDSLFDADFALWKSDAEAVFQDEKTLNIYVK